MTGLKPTCLDLSSCFDVQRWVLPSGAVGQMPQGRAGVIIAMADRCRANDTPLQALTPVAIPAGSSFANAGDLPALVLTICPDQGAAIAFYGSRALGAARAGSDLDLLCLSNDPMDRDQSIGKVSFFFANSDRFLDRAGQGDLFVQSVLETAQVLHDPDGRFDGLRQAFAPAASYNAVLHHAADFAAFLMSPHVRAAAPQDCVLKLRWCVRAVLMATGRDPFSSPEMLADQDRAILAVLSDPASLDWSTAQGAVAAFWNERPEAPNTPVQASVSTMIEFFRQTGNETALRFIAKHQRALAGYLARNGVPNSETPLHWQD